MPVALVKKTTDAHSDIAMRNAQCFLAGDVIKIYPDGFILRGEAATLGIFETVQVTDEEAKGLTESVYEPAKVRALLKIPVLRMFYLGLPRPMMRARRFTFSTLDKSRSDNKRSLHAS